MLWNGDPFHDTCDVCYVCPSSTPPASALIGVLCHKEAGIPSLLYNARCS
jgi:hypothetical protein